MYTFLASFNRTNKDFDIFYQKLLINIYAVI